MMTAILAKAILAKIPAKPYAMSILKSLFIVGLMMVSLALTGCTGSDAGMAVDTAKQIAMAHELTVFHSPTCGCCGLWIEHVQSAGFQIKDEITEDMDPIKQAYGVPANLASCHTASVDGYVIEGHIPAEDLQRLLIEKPAIAGIAVPGMPTGSPGMESGDYVEPYTVFSFTEDGAVATFAEHS
ncbi:MAG: DUF411 domain-containing protein [Cyanobacteria bacterium P01_G01_bin.38]